MDKNDTQYYSKGLSTKTALNLLHDNILEELCKFENSKKNKRYYLQWIKGYLQHNNQQSVFRWTSVTALLLCSFALLLSYIVNPEKNSELLYHSMFVFLLVVVNLCLSLWDNHLKSNELLYLTKKILKEVKECSLSAQWEPKNYPHLHSPISPCITLQWTIRDGNLVNLPWALLVHGDIILMRPGQKVPGDCRALEKTEGCEEGDVLHYGEIYSPYVDGMGDGLSSPKVRVPLEEKKFMMIETPFLINFRILLQEAFSRPVSVFNKQGYYLFARTLEFGFFPVFAVLTLLCNIIRLYYNIWSSHWSEGLLVVPVCVVLPLLPLLFPMAWVILHWYGTASLLTVCNETKNVKKHLSQDPFEGIELDNLKLTEQRFSCKSVREEFLKIVCGTQDVAVRSANFLHVLASITNLCCLDKKGILSWPNPTAEKLFFLHHKDLDSVRTDVSNSVSLYSEESPKDKHSEEEDEEERASGAGSDDDCQTQGEPNCVLMSLTHDPLKAFALQFDDVSWSRYLYSLKPLGLSILLNTCHSGTQVHYTKFCSHITCEAMYNEDLVPVSQRSDDLLHSQIPVYGRGCLCELAKQMGFKGKAAEPFRLEHQLCTFRHVPSGMECKDRLARSLSITKLKFPFPHMVSVLVRDKHSGKVEIMSQGTADIILDSCADFWDGFDVRPLTEKERKKILDFYHRTSVSAYCTAFSYRPTSCEVKTDLSNLYMELPINPSHLYRVVRSPTPHCSTEALYGDLEHTECDEVTDVDGCLKMQCKQIFLGMVTMQYQARTDMVRMIEELEASCIRFVHFSKENELRSRVFSEKMGLESGWNCHISLLSDRTKPDSGASSRLGNTSSKTSGLTLLGQSTEIVTVQETSNPRFRDRNCFRSKSLHRKAPSGIRSVFDVFRTLSHSAPSAINLDVAQVKFEDDVSVRSQSLSGLSSEEYLQNEPEETRLLNCRWHRDSKNCECLGITAKFERRHHNMDDTKSSSRTSKSSFSLNHLHSPSQEISSSSDQTASLKMYDMSNRARLPKGVENIRPHLENVDNVPLLVSLFTDCTTPATKEMLVIMQSYTEVVVVVGSTANMENMTLFMQADLCIGIDPSYPQVCMKQPVFIRPVGSNVTLPSDLAQKLNALPCSLTFERDQPISLIQLILRSRNFMQHFMSCFQFWVSCNLSISFLQLTSAAAFLPPILSSGDVLWMICVPIPLLSVSLAFAPINPAVMNQATGKNTVVVNRESLKYILLYYITKFTPSLFVVMLCAIWIFNSFCHELTSNDCVYVYPKNISTSVSNSLGGWESDNRYSLNVIQTIVTFQLVIYFGIISVCFVHRMYQLWIRNTLLNIVWTVTLFTIIVLQIIYSGLSISSLGVDGGEGKPGLRDVPLGPVLIGVLWPLFLIPLNELIKKTEIRVNVRYQKRAKLEFGTKLGMNSPF